MAPDELIIVSSSHRYLLSRHTRRSYRHHSHLLKGTFPPCTVDQPLLASFQLLNNMRRRCCLTHHSTWELKQTGRSVEGDATVSFHIQAIEFPRQILCVIILDFDFAAGARARFSHRCRRAPLACFYIGMLATELGESIFQLGNSSLKLFRIG